MVDLAKIARALRHYRVGSVKLSGGEPTVRNDLAEIVTLFAANGLAPTVITNGIRMTSPLIESMRRGGAKIKFSVHAPDKRNDDIIRNRSFERIKANAGMVVSAGIPLALNCVINAATFGSMESLCSLAVEWGADKISFLPMVLRGSARDEGTAALMGPGIYHACLERLAQLRLAYMGLRIGLVDIRVKPYWIIDHDNTLFISGDREENDVVLGRRGGWLNDVSITTW